MIISQEENPFPTQSPPKLSNYERLAQNVDLNDPKSENIETYFYIRYVVLMIFLAIGETSFCLCIFSQHLIGILAFICLILVVYFLFAISIISITKKSERILLMVCLIDVKNYFHSLN